MQPISLKDLRGMKDYQALPAEEKRKVLASRFPDFTMLPRLEQDKVINFKEPSLGERAGRAVVGGLEGIGQGALESLRGLGEASMRGFGGEVPLRSESRAKLQQLEQPRTTSQKVGKFTERAAEFVAPEAAGLRLARSAPLIARMGTEALKTGLISGAQTGGKPGEMLTSAAAGAAFPFAGAVTRQLGKGVLGYLGFRTGVGTEVIKEAVTNASADFKDAMRGNNLKDAEIAKKVRDAYDRLVKRRGDDYRAQLANLPSKILNTATQAKKDLLKSLPSWGIQWSRRLIPNPGGPPIPGPVVLDFSNTKFATDPGAQAHIQSLVKTIDEWTDHTTLGIDRLKQAVDNLWGEADSARALIQKTKAQIRDDLNKKIPGYEEMTSGYARASDFLNQVKKEFSLSMKSGKGPTIRKLIPYLFHQNNDYRKDLIETLGHEAGVDLKGTLAGRALRPAIPRSLTSRVISGAEPIGVAATAYEAITSGHYLGLIKSAFLLTDLLASSPRAVGEMLSLISRVQTPTVRALSAAGGQTARGAGLAKINQPEGQQ